MKTVVLRITIYMLCIFFAIIDRIAHGEANVVLAILSPLAVIMMVVEISYLREELRKRKYRIL